MTHVLRFAKSIGACISSWALALLDLGSFVVRQFFCSNFFSYLLEDFVEHPLYQILVSVWTERERERLRTKQS